MFYYLIHILIAWLVIGTTVTLYNWKRFSNYMYKERPVFAHIPWAGPIAFIVCVLLWPVFVSSGIQRWFLYQSVKFMLWRIKVKIWFRKKGWLKDLEKEREAKFITDYGLDEGIDYCLIPYKDGVKKTTISLKGMLTLYHHPLIAPELKADVKMRLQSRLPHLNTIRKKYDLLPLTWEDIEEKKSLTIYNFYFSAKQKEISRGLMQMHVLGVQYPTREMFVHGKEYTEMIEFGNRQSNFDDAVLVHTGPSEGVTIGKANI